MSNTPAFESENKLHSDHFKKFLDAIETLYIKGNLSARIAFAKEWPDAAHFILGEELVRYDTEGTPDRDRRAVLEDEAEGRRIEMADVAATLENKSVNKGVLQMEYVGPLVQKLGRDLSLLLYSPRIVDRFIPPPPPPEEPKVEAKPEPVKPPPISRAAPLPRMDDIKPISVERAEDQKPAAEPESISIVPDAIKAAPAAPPPVVPFAPAQESQTIKPIVPKTEDGQG